MHLKIVKDKKWIFTVADDIQDDWYDPSNNHHVGVCVFDFTWEKGRHIYLLQTTLVDQCGKGNFQLRKVDYFYLLLPELFI